MNVLEGRSYQWIITKNWCFVMIYLANFLLNFLSFGSLRRAYNKHIRDDEDEERSSKRWLFILMGTFWISILDTFLDVGASEMRLVEMLDLGFGLKERGAGVYGSDENVHDIT
jgi:hypothetical protein